MIDDICYARNRSKNTGKLAWLFDHALNRSYKDYPLLTLGFTDGFSFFPIDFMLLSGKMKVSSRTIRIDCRNSGDKCLLEADRSMTAVAIELVERALKRGIYAKHILMDKGMICSMKALGTDVIGLMKTPRQSTSLMANSIVFLNCWRKRQKTFLTIPSFHRFA